MIQQIPRIMISAVSSGSGKTTVVCGLLKALKNRGMNISAFKCGPDYIDPMFHTKVLGINSKNLDGFFCDKHMLNSLFTKEACKKDINIIEGVMGYYDGLAMDSYQASSYETALNTKTPVVLVVNSKGAALTIVSVIKGVMDFAKDSNIKGVILNNISPFVYESLKKVIESNINIKVLGYLPFCKEIAIDSRHLGLLTPNNIKELDNKIERLGKIAEECFDIDGIIAISKDAEPLEIYKYDTTISAKKVKIGVAYDSAFCFYYKDNIDLLEKLGCEIIYFSPLKDRYLPKDICGLILGGGYPELYCEELSANKSMIESIKNNIENGMPCLAECGGFMYLHKIMEDNYGKKYEMTNIIKASSYKKERLVRFGYITLTAQEDTFVLKKGEQIKAHEFHYWDSTCNGSSFIAQKPSGKMWECIHSYKNLICGYPHIFYYSNTKFAERFVEKSAEYKRC